MFPTRVVATRLGSYGYLSALAGSLTGAVAGTLAASFLVATVFGLSGLLTLQMAMLWPLAFVPLGAALGCTLALRTKSCNGAAATALLLLTLIAGLGVGLSFWRPVDVAFGPATLWALRSVLFFALALLTCGARGLYHILDTSGLQGGAGPRRQRVKPGRWVTNQK